MKKLALVLVVLLAVSGAAFAEVDVYVGGSATTSFIFDLDDNGFALENYLDADVELTFGGDVERSGEGDVYGEITITNLTLSQEYYVAGASYVNIDEAAVNATTGTHWSEAPVWTAKIVAGDFYVKVSGGESLRARRDVMANVLDDFSLIALSYKGAYPSFTSAGNLSLGYTVADVASFVVKLGTENAVPTVGNNFGAAVDVSLLAVENLGFDASFVYGTDGTMGVGATVGYDVAVSEMTVTPYAGIDFDIAATTFEVGGGLKVDWESDADGIKKGSSTKGFLDDKYMIASGADVAVKYAGGNVDLAVTAALLPVENLTSIALFEMDDLSTMGFGAYVDYTVPETVKGYGWFKYTTAVDFLVGAEYIGIDNTALGVKYVYADNAITAYAKVSAW